MHCAIGHRNLGSRYIPVPSYPIGLSHYLQSAHYVAISKVTSVYRSIPLKVAPLLASQRVAPGFLRLKLIQPPGPPLSPAADKYLEPPYQDVLDLQLRAWHVQY